MSNTAAIPTISGGDGSSSTPGSAAGSAGSAPGATPSISSGGGGGDSGGNQITKVTQAGAGFTVVEYADGKVERRTGSRNWRNNNPGNLEFGAFSRRYGAVGTDGRFAVFPTYEAGRAAKEALLFEGRGYRGLNIAQMLNRYAPPVENNTNMYINSVVSAVGVPATTPLQSLNAEQRRAMLAAMERVEGFRVGRVEVLQQPTTAAAQAVPGAPTVDGGALNRVGTEVAAVDQARARASGGSQTTVITPPAVNPAPTNIRSTTHGEVPLNRRLETQAI
jgi:hypothetical protein